MSGETYVLRMRNPNPEPELNPWTPLSGYEAGLTRVLQTVYKCLCWIECHDRRCATCPACKRCVWVPNGFLMTFQFQGFTHTHTYTYTHTYIYHMVDLKMTHIDQSPYFPSDFWNFYFSITSHFWCFKPRFWCVTPHFWHLWLVDHIPISQFLKAWSGKQLDGEDRDQIHRQGIPAFHRGGHPARSTGVESFPLCISMHVCIHTHTRTHTHTPTYIDI